MPLTLRVPALGESVTEATLGAWKRAEGDEVSADEPLVEVESEKATLEVPSPGAGVLRKILRKAGETVAVGDAIAEIEQIAAGEAPAKPGAPAKPDASAVTGAPAQKPASNGGVRAAPSARRAMADSGLSPEEVAGSGRGGRISKQDVDRTLQARATEGRGPDERTPQERATQARATQARATQERATEAAQERATQERVSDPRMHAPAVPPRAELGAGALSSFRPATEPRDGAVERVVPMSPLRRTVARRLVEAQQTAAILTTFNEVDMTNVMALRERYQERFVKQHGIKLGFMSFFVKAAIDGLKTFPAVNAEIRGSDIVYKDHYDIGVAVGGGKGLVVPVVRDADRLTFAELEKGIAELAGRARDNKLTMKELEGGTFTISNGGVYGSLLSTPILNPPQSGILGLHSIQKRAVVVGDAVTVRSMMYLALSYDHRLVDGREAVQFLVRVKECVEDPERVLLEV